MDTINIFPSALINFKVIVYVTLFQRYPSFGRFLYTGERNRQNLRRSFVFSPPYSCVIPSHAFISPFFYR